MAVIVHMPKIHRLSPHAREMWLRSQATYLAAEAYMRAVTLQPCAELVDLHPLEREQYINDINRLVINRLKDGK